MSEAPWDPTRPIFRQVRDEIAARMLEGTLPDGQALPSIRQMAARYRLSPLTILKAYRQLVDEHLIEKQRGRGMFVRLGACEALRQSERERFLAAEWPKLRLAIERLGLSAAQLLHSPAHNAQPAEPPQTEPSA